MKRITLIICLLCSLTLAAIPFADFPQTRITNGIIEAELYLPDAKQGYYRGTRFDWSGVVSSLIYKGHTYFGQWFDKYSPTLHDAITGPVEAFVPIGYDEAKTGSEFMIIGVGGLRKPDEAKYHFANPYEITNPGKWSVKKGKDQVTFVHELTDAAGYSYVYQKVVKLTKDKPEMVLEHTLKNTGKRAIETNTYNHNFFVIDQQPTGPEIVTTFPFEIQADGLGRNGLAEVQDKQVVYLKELKKGENVFSSGLQGFSSSPKDYDIKIENRKSGAGVRITGDQPLSKMVFWASATTSCPEPYIQVRAEPGQEFKWTLTYQFYTLPAAASGN